MADIYDQFKDFKSFEVTFENKNNELQKIFCTVKSVENDSIILDANNQENKDIVAEKDTELKLYIYTESGIYSAASKVLSVSSGIMNTEYAIAYPANSKHSQRREYFRADLSIEFKMNVVNNEDSSKSFFVDSKTRNICGKGMSFVYDKPFPEYSSIDIDLIFPDKTISTSAAIVYSKQIVVGSHPKFIHAFAFTNISQKNIDFIVKQCFLHQLELRKRLQQ